MRLQPEGRVTVGDGPDALAVDPPRDSLAAEPGVLITLNIHTEPAGVTARAELGDNAHVVAVDPTNGQVHFPLLNSYGQPTLLITEPIP